MLTLASKYVFHVFHFAPAKIQKHEKHEKHIRFSCFSFCVFHFGPGKYTKNMYFHGLAHVLLPRVLTPGLSTDNSAPPHNKCPQVCRSAWSVGRYGPARVPGLSSPITGSILPAWLGGIATYHRCALPSLLRTTPPQPVTSAGPTGTRTCEFHHESLCSVAHSYRADS